MHQHLLPEIVDDTTTRAVAAADAAARSAGVEVRGLDTPAGTAAAADLFCSIWRAPDEAAPVSGDLMRALSTTGNYVAGAYSGDTLVGAAVAFFTDESPAALHSHICGVAGAMQGRSVGFALKLDQRAWALRRGISVIGWTVDPLVRRNIYFNLAKLGAAVSDYLPDFYGPMRDGVNTGDPSDRVLLTWSLAAPDTDAAAHGHPKILTPPPDTHPLLSVGPGGEPVVADPPAVGPLLCELPADILRIRSADPALATAWRHTLRDTLTGALARGYHITGVTRDGCFVLA